MRGIIGWRRRTAGGRDQRVDRREASSTWRGERWVEIAALLWARPPLSSSRRYCPSARMRPGGCGLATFRGCRSRRSPRSRLRGSWRSSRPTSCRRRWRSPCSGASAVQLAVILPYTALRPVEVRSTEAAPGPRTLRLVIVNVFMPEPPGRPAEGHHSSTGSRSGPCGRDRRVVVRAAGGRFCRIIRAGSPIRCPTPTA